MQTVNALLYVSGIYVLAFAISMFVGLIILIIDRASGGRIKRKTKQ